MALNFVTRYKGLSTGIPNLGKLTKDPGFRRVTTMGVFLVNPPRGIEVFVKVRVLPTYSAHVRLLLYMFVLPFRM